MIRLLLAVDFLHALELGCSALSCLSVDFESFAYFRKVFRLRPRVCLFNRSAHTAKPGRGNGEEVISMGYESSVAMERTYEKLEKNKRRVECPEAKLE